MRISSLVSIVFQAYYLFILARVILSWLRLPPRGILVERVGPVVYLLTEPLLRPIRRALRRYQGQVPVDFSPMVLIIALSILESVTMRILMMAGL